MQYVMIAYIIASVLFIMSLKGLSSPKTALTGNYIGISGMVIAIVATFFLPEVSNISLPVAGIIIGAIIGVYMAIKAKMTSLPQMVALFNGFVGLAAVLIGFATIMNPASSGANNALDKVSMFEVALGTIIGAVTFTGSVVAFAKLHGIWPRKLRLPYHVYINLMLLIATVVLTYLLVIEKDYSMQIIYISSITAITLVLGVTAVMMIGGADMPVVISVLNCYSGLAGAGVGFTMMNPLLIITGSLVGASGAILSYIMCNGMNRSLTSVLIGGFGSETGASNKDKTNPNEGKVAKASSPEDAAFIMKNSSKVIVVPGYGMAVAGAQHALKEMADVLKANGVEVKYAIHPVAGRMPGHMNVLLAEANIPYEEVFELDDINREFASADCVYVIGANDVTNPLAKTDTTSPIYGMPILEVAKAKTIFFVKRSMAVGYSGVDNPLFFAYNTMMLFGDAKKITEEVVKALNNS